MQGCLLVPRGLCAGVSEPFSFAGRAGRVSKGYCYRLVHKDFWASSIPAHAVPEMLVRQAGHCRSFPWATEGMCFGVLYSS